MPRPGPHLIGGEPVETGHVFQASPLKEKTYARETLGRRTQNDDHT